MFAFTDRRDAGQKLAGVLKPRVGDEDLIVLGVPRGGIPVAREVARMLGAPMELFIVRELGAPGREKLALGSISSGGVVVLNRPLIVAMNISRTALNKVIEQEQLELANSEQVYGGGRPFPELTGRTVILVDDGLAAGAAMLTAVHAVRRCNPYRVIVAVPVAPPVIEVGFMEAGVELVYVIAPDVSVAVGEWYQDFSPVGDEEICMALKLSGDPTGGGQI